MNALPYSTLESKKAGEALDVLLSAFILRLKKNKKLFRSELQNYWSFKGRLYRAFPWLQAVVVMSLVGPHPPESAASQFSRGISVLIKSTQGMYEEWKGQHYPQKSSWTLTVGLDWIGYW